MVFNQSRKYAISSSTWERQRDSFVQQTGDLNDEFEKFKKRGAESNHPAAEVFYTVPARSQSIGAVESIVLLPQGYHSIKVFSGCAWVTYDANDYILYANDELTFEQDSATVVVSSKGQETLNFQITL